ncbi:hypothetical protein PVA17_03050 [Lysinibacillus sp. CNPSo 3705]|uniref:hypothetical protein n=1 Tax=Lysinibacillus sp. CNPSo 3705 TaxID=3028148 RepID=UPI002363BCF6|nr:hypothetical protein [Lysinibacillus sp. CNPSo 3705]MDD1501748.1 hypothetical protein [Lysinibacillus sp. CNPSo 3705]
MNPVVVIDVTKDKIKYKLLREWKVVCGNFLIMHNREELDKFIGFIGEIMPNRE